MATQLREVEAFLRGQEAVELANETKDLASKVGAAGFLDIAEHQSRRVRATPDDAEWRRQTDNFIRVGYWQEIGYKDPERYRLSIPGFLPPDPDLPHPLIIEGRISHERKLELLKIPNYVIDKVTNQIAVPEIAYTVCTRPPVLFRGTYAEALRQIPDYRIGSPMTEVDDAYLNLYSKYSEFFAPWADAGNSRDGVGRVPYLDVDGDGPTVYARWTGSPRRRWRVLFRGKNIGT